MKTFVKRAWYGEFIGEIRLASTIPIYKYQRELNITFSRKIFDLDICNDVFDLHYADDDKRLFTLLEREELINTNVPFLPSQPIRIPFVAKTWQEVRGLRAEIDFDLGTSLAECDTVCGSKSTSYSPTITLITVPVDVGEFKKIPYILAKSSVLLEDAELIDISISGFTQTTPMVASVVINDPAKRSVEINGITSDRWPRDFVKTEINIVLKLTYANGALDNSPFPGVILWPFLPKPIFFSKCPCTDLEYKVGVPPPNGLLDRLTL